MVIFKAALADGGGIAGIGSVLFIDFGADVRACAKSPNSSSSSPDNSGVFLKSNILLTVNLNVKKN